MTSTKDIYTIDPDFYRSYTKEERARHNSQLLGKLFIWTILLVAGMFAVYTWMKQVKSKELNSLPPVTVQKEAITPKPKIMIEEKKETIVASPPLIKLKPVVQKTEKKSEIHRVARAEKKPKIEPKAPVIENTKRVISDELSVEYIEAVRKALGK